MSRGMALCDQVLDPDDLGRTMVSVLKRKGLQNFIGAGVPIEAHRLPSIFDWKSFFEDSGFTSMGGGLLLDDTANHSFTFVSRQGASPSKSHFTNGVCACALHPELR
jgi:hypothetical protein